MNLKQVDVIMSEVGEVEDEVFKRRRAAETAEQVPCFDAVGRLECRGS